MSTCSVDLARGRQRPMRSTTPSTTGRCAQRIDAARRRRAVFAARTVRHSRRRGRAGHAAGHRRDRDGPEVAAAGAAALCRRAACASTARRADRSVTRAFLGLGSNLGDRRQHLREAVAAIPDVVAVSRVYETAPVGGPEQGAYLNIVVRLETERSPARAARDLSRLRGGGATGPHGSLGAAHARRRRAVGRRPHRRRTRSRRSPPTHVRAGVRLDAAARSCARAHSAVVRRTAATTKYGCSARCDCPIVSRGRARPRRWIVRRSPGLAGLAARRCLRPR